MPSEEIDKKVEEINEDGPTAGLGTTSADSGMGFGLGLGFKGKVKNYELNNSVKTPNSPKNLNFLKCI